MPISCTNYLKFPFFRYSLFLISGIVLVYLNPKLISWFTPTFSIVVCGSFFMLSFGFRMKWVLSLFWIFLGGVSYSLNFSNSDISNIEYSLVEIKEISSSKKTFFGELKIGEVNNCWVPVDRKVKFNISGDSSFILPKVGELYLIRTRWQLIARPQNSLDLDYYQYLKLKGIYHQSFLKTKDIFRYKNSELDDHARLPSREYLQYVFKSILPEKSHFGIANALFLGNKDALSPEQKEHFSIAGVMHLFAVSGLHIGILYFGFFGVARVIPYGKRLKPVILTLLALSFIWWYGWVVGFSPSVLRSLFMFSFLGFSNLIGRKGITVNIVFSSAVFQLLYNPMLLFQVGFQLSYVAVLGLIFLVPKIQSIYQPAHFILDKIWALMAVSIAAQIVTLPLTLFYFHQFSVYFLIANLLLVPLAPVIMIIGLVSILLFETMLGVIFGKMLSFSMFFINELTQQIANWPHSAIGNIQISTLEVAMMYLLIFGFYCLINQRRRFWLYFSTICLLFWLVLIERENFQSNLPKLYLNRRYNDFHIEGSMDSNRMNVIGGSFFQRTQMDRILGAKSIVFNNSIERVYVSKESFYFKWNYQNILFLNDRNLPFYVIAPSDIIIMRADWAEEYSEKLQDQWRELETTSPFPQIGKGLVVLKSVDYVVIK